MSNATSISDEVWRLVPPEEKFGMMAAAHAAGVLTCTLFVLVAATLAVALYSMPIFWGALLLTPFVFQFASGKKWREVRPLAMLEYLAARSVARRYAFTQRSKDLSLDLLFRGSCSRIYDAAQVFDALEATLEKTARLDVWVALFADTVVVMSERRGGAKLEFAHPINEKLRVSGESPPGEGEYSARRAVKITFNDRRTSEDMTFQITSTFPAALVVFEKKLTDKLKKFAAVDAPSLTEGAGKNLDEAEDAHPLDFK